jgi:succinoglycan biosynthesis protein ExoV
MKLQYFKGEYPNFGDELNNWLWPQLLPNFLDNDQSVLFIGIGSIIGEQYASSSTKIIFGTGYVPNYFPQVPDVTGDDWDIFFVRGPRTAYALGLPNSYGIGDSAILLRALNVQSRREPKHIGFMPHWQSMRRGSWQRVCGLAGIRLIDPCAPVDHIISEILNCTSVITEAMHGAIVADALRVPWIPVLPIDHAHRDKWYDWAEALNIKLRQHRLWPSSPAEVKLAATYRPLLSSIAEGLTSRPIARLTKSSITYTAAQRLSALATEYPCLSADSELEHALQRMLDKLNQLQRKYRK